jgi:hypothetical protein
MGGPGDGGGPPGTPPPDEGPRASDADRDRFAAQLHEHYAAGRLDHDELEERLDRVYRARTLVELYGVTSDLPHPGPRPVAGWPSQGARRPWWKRWR